MKFSEIAPNTRGDIQVMQTGELTPAWLEVWESKWDFPRKSGSDSVVGHRRLRRPKL